LASAFCNVFIHKVCHVLSHKKAKIRSHIINNTIQQKRYSDNVTLSERCKECMRCCREGETWIERRNLTLEPWLFNVYLDERCSGKTTLMRAHGLVLIRHQGKDPQWWVDVTGVAVRERTFPWCINSSSTTPPHRPTKISHHRLPFKLRWMKKTSGIVAYEKPLEMLRIRPFLIVFASATCLVGQQHRTANGQEP